jgi:uncharacterized delta-60 repeat protein
MPDGSCVVSGSVASAGAQQMALWRFNADGSLDTAFGSGGMALGPAPFFGYGQLSLAPNGDIAQFGSAGANPNATADGTLAFYRNNGTLDTSFGSSGESNFETLIPNALAFQPNGQIIIAGESPGNSLTRLNANGSLDAGFGQNGSVATSPYNGGTESPTAVAYLPGGLILVAGTDDGLFELDRYIAPTSSSTPKITWANPSGIAYGTALGATQLDATASVPGTFTYSPAVGTVLQAGNNQSLSVTFTPADTTDYSTATATVTINVTQATPTITWAKPADITVGTPLGTTQLDATSPVTGSFTYTPAAGTVLGAGANQSLGVTFTPTDTTDYTSATATVQINVKKANPRTPTIIWANPADITFGTPLGAAQPDATASVPGTFAYSPAAGTVLHAGSNQTLSVTFTPTDAIDYTGASAAAKTNVAQAKPTVTWADPADIAAGTPLGAAQLNATASVSGIFNYTLRGHE